jgi:hypothetical protein
MSVMEVQRRPRPSAREVAHQLAAVIADLPRFATAPLLRGWHQHWGATRDETAAAMPGDDLVPNAQFRCTRAVSIEAPPEAVWPWLVQVGCLRAGFYADDLLDNLGHPSSHSILPEFQNLEVGQWVPMAPTPTEVTAFKVAGFETNRSLLWQQPVSTWAWKLDPLPDGATRLVTRLHIDHDWKHPAKAVFSLLLTEFGDFAMMRRMLLGIKERAESRTHVDPSGLNEAGTQ